MNRQLLHLFRTSLTCVVFLWLTVAQCFGQQADSPVTHMTQITETDAGLQKKYLAYMSTLAHANSARKMEKRREELIASIDEAIRNAGKVPLYKGDQSLRETYVEYLQILLTVFQEDYHKIVDMEAIAEQSYDNMEAYLLAQEQAEVKLQEAAKKIEPVYNEYAARHQVQLVEPEKENKVSKKLEVIGRVNEHYHKVYLIFFKSTHQEAYLMKSIQDNDVNGVEQNRSVLSRYATEGLASLSQIKAFQGKDASLVNSCRKALTFYKQEADTKIQAVTDYMLKVDEFQKISKAMETKPEKQRTQADIDGYNKAVGEMNASINNYNKTISALNEERTRVINDWNTSARKFMDVHIPVSK